MPEQLKVKEHEVPTFVLWLCWNLNSTTTPASNTQQAQKKKQPNPKNNHTLKVDNCWLKGHVAVKVNYPLV